MAVYKRTYRPYQGPLSPAWSRFLVVTRYTLADTPRSLPFLFLLALSALAPLLCALIIYLHHNLSALQLLGINVVRLVPIDARFFLTYLGFQSMLAFFMAALVGPGLISSDLANHALPLYLARPFSRTEYVLGKMTALLGMLSLMTWIPGFLLFGFASYLEGFRWTMDHLRIPFGLFFGGGIGILLLSLLALALAAWVKRKPAAGALMFGLLVVAGGFGAAANHLLHTRWGHLLNISHLVGEVGISLFEQPMRRGEGVVGDLFFRVAPGEALPLWCCWAALAAICLFCLWMLSRKIRGAEVVR